MRGPCPFRPAFWHEDDDEDDDEDRDEGAPESRGIPAPKFVPPGRRKASVEKWATAGVVAEAEAIVREYQEGHVPWLEPARTGQKSSPMQAFLALALEGFLTAGAVGLLGHGLKSSMPLASRLEGQLSGLFRTRSAMQGRGGAGQGFRVDWSAKLARLSGESRK